MDGKLEGRTAIVTGAARGIGAALARGFVLEGAHVTGVDVLDDAGTATGAAIAAEAAAAGTGGSFLYVHCDVSDEAQVGTAVVGVLAARGRVDIMVNNAAVQVEALAADVTVADFHRVVNVNLLGCVLFCREVLPAMVRQRRGAIVNMSSVNAFSADALLPIYGATKAAIIGYTKSVAIAYGPHGIRANAICPGDVDTELNRACWAAHPDPAGFRANVEAQYPVRRIASTDEIARIAVFLASDDAAFVSGTEIVVDGAITARIYEL